MVGMRERIRGWVESISPKKIAADYTAGQIVTFCVSIISASAVAWWADPEMTRAWLVAYVLGIAIALGVLWVLFAFGWRWLYPAPTRGAQDATGTVHAAVEKPARERNARIVAPPALPQQLKPEARRLSAYEIEEKLKAADRVLALLRDTRDTATLVRETQHKAMLHFAHRESAQAHIFDLGRCRSETESLCDKVRTFCDEIHQYPDLVQSVQPLIGTIHNVTAAVEHFRTAYNNLTQVMRCPDPTADSSVFAFQIQPFLSELGGRLNYLEDQRNKTRDAVIAIRQEAAK
jgi:hypothetical protein